MSDKRIEIGELWRKINHGLHDTFRQAFKEAELPVGTLMMLRPIGKHPGVTVSEMARRTGMVKSHISTTVDQLVKKGLVEKRPDPQDQRLQRLYLTEPAQQYATAVETKLQAVWVQVVEELSEDELDQVYRGFQILKEALERSKAKTESL